ncbi:sulfite exporter TauE/SafE family protein [Superficieibacter sp. 1612_C1]|uniref:sulfite exporter TauE/SafE family protein n=1 Tax=Superficieibacter sp. 1612_C1 TaxID=2780382 RepID=UPI001883E97F|nr:sulfite exporter TauE/SafE family protein [Superficieibacter sp. 1612_C1]
MSEIHYLNVIIIFIAAGLVKGVTGMGLPTVAMGLLGTFMPLPVAAALLIIPSLVTNVWQLFSGPALTALWSRLWLMMLCIVAGTLAGSTFLISIDAGVSGFLLGAALIVYAAYALYTPVFTVPKKQERWLSPVIGASTGIITGATGVFVMPAVPYLQTLNFSKDELVQALGLSFTVSTLALAAGLYAQDAYHLNQLSLSLFSVFPALIGMWLGQKIRSKISAKTFRKCFLLFLILLGVELTLRSLLF